MSEVTVTCECGAPMVERVNRLNLSRFYGCSRYPDCQVTRAVPAAVEMRRAGGLPLPGLDAPGEER